MSWIAVHVVPSQLSEAGLITLRELRPIHPLRRLSRSRDAARAGAPARVVARRRLALVFERDYRLPRREVREWHVGGVFVVAMCERKWSGRVKASVGEDVVDGNALPSGVEFDHEVTPWMSRVILVRESALNSDQLQALTGQGPTFSMKVQSAGSIRGVGPAACPGNCRRGAVPGESGPIAPDWRPVKPRVTMADFLRRRVKGASSRTTR